MSEGRQREPDVEHPPQDRADQQDLQQRGQDVEQHEGQKRLDRLGPALDRARQSAGLALQMEAQRQRVQVPEDVERHRPDRALGHLGEDRVAQFAERQRQDAGEAIGQDHADGQHRHRPGRRAQRVDGVLVEHRHIDVGDLGDEQADDGGDDPDTKLHLVARPQIGQQRSDGFALPQLARSGEAAHFGVGHECGPDGVGTTRLT